MFNLAFGLKINTAKLTISPIKAPVTDQWGIVQKNLSVNYLGTQLVGKPQSMNFWEQTIEKIHKKSKWMEIQPNF